MERKKNSKSALGFKEISGFDTINNISLSAISKQSSSFYSGNLSKSNSQYYVEQKEKQKRRDEIQLQNIKDTCSFMPSLSRQSKSLATLRRNSSLTKKSVFESLYETPISTKSNQSNKNFSFTPNIKSDRQISQNTQSYLKQPIIERLTQQTKASYTLHQDERLSKSLPRKKLESYKENQDIFTYLHNKKLERPMPTMFLKPKPYEINNSLKIVERATEQSLSSLFLSIANNSNTISLQGIWESQSSSAY
jgi:hypothetical protein